jgi:large subunit ribosomal protein L35
MWGFEQSIHMTKGNSMPKQKTHKGTKKRFRLSGKGKAMHRQSGTSHLAARMSQKRKRNLRGTTSVDKTIVSQIREALNGYSS